MKFSMAKRGQWRLPTLEFSSTPKIDSSIDREKLIRNSQILVQKFADFEIQGRLPLFTRSRDHVVQFKPGPGVKISESRRGRTFRWRFRLKM